MLREETAEEEILVEDTEKVNILIIISSLPFEKVTILIIIPILSLLSILMTFLTIISILLLSPTLLSLPSKESVATDEGFHDESTNDTDPLVNDKKSKQTHKSFSNSKNRRTNDFERAKTRAKNI